MDQNSLLQQISQNISSNQFADRIKAINVLRAINKQFPSDSNYLIQNFIAFIVRMIKGPKSIEHKIVLIYLQEVLRNEPNLGLSPEIISQIVPLILHKKISGKGFIKKISGHLLNFLIENCSLEGMLYSLIMNSGNKNNLIAELSMKSFRKVLHRPSKGMKSVQNSVTNFSKELFFVLFKGLVLNLLAKRIKVMKNSEDSLLFLLEILSQDKFVFIIELMINEQCIPFDFKDKISKGISNAQKRVQIKKEKSSRLNKKYSSPSSYFKQSNGQDSSSKNTFSQNSRDISNSLLSHGGINSSQRDTDFPTGMSHVLGQNGVDFLNKISHNNLHGLKESIILKSGKGQRQTIMDNSHPEFGENINCLKRSYSNASTTYQSSREHSNSNRSKGGNSKKSSGLKDFIKKQRRMMKSSQPAFSQGQRFM